MWLVRYSCQCMRRVTNRRKAVLLLVGFSSSQTYLHANVVLTTLGWKYGWINTERTDFKLKTDPKGMWGRGYLVSATESSRLEQQSGCCTCASGVNTHWKWKLPMLSLWVDVGSWYSRRDVQEILLLLLHSQEFTAALWVSWIESTCSYPTSSLRFILTSASLLHVISAHVVSSLQISRLNFSRISLVFSLHYFLIYEVHLSVSGSSLIMCRSSFVCISNCWWRHNYAWRKRTCRSENWARSGFKACDPSRIIRDSEAMLFSPVKSDNGPIIFPVFRDLLPHNLTVRSHQWRFWVKQRCFVILLLSRHRLAMYSWRQCQISECSSEGSDLSIHILRNLGISAVWASLVITSLLMQSADIELT